MQMTDKNTWSSLISEGGSGSGSGGKAAVLVMVTHQC